MGPSYSSDVSTFVDLQIGVLKIISKVWESDIFKCDIVLCLELLPLLSPYLNKITGHDHVINVDKNSLDLVHPTGSFLICVCHLIFENGEILMTLPICTLT